MIVNAMTQQAERNERISNELRICLTEYKKTRGLFINRFGQTISQEKYNSGLTSLWIHELVRYEHKKCRAMFFLPNNCNHGLLSSNRLLTPILI